MLINVPLHNRLSGLKRAACRVVLSDGRFSNLKSWFSLALDILHSSISNPTLKLLFKNYCIINSDKIISSQKPNRRV